MPPEMPGGTRLAPCGGPDVDHRIPLTVSADRAYHGIDGAESASGPCDQSHVQSLPAKRLYERLRRSILLPPVLDLAVNLRIDGSATTEMHRDRETKCREEVRGEAQRCGA